MGIVNGPVTTLLVYYFFFFSFIFHFPLCLLSFFLFIYSSLAPWLLSGLFKARLVIMTLPLRPCFRCNKHDDVVSNASESLCLRFVF